MIVAEIFERAVSMVKTVWRKRGDEISRQEVRRMIATHDRAKSPQEKKHES